MRSLHQIRYEISESIYYVPKLSQGHLTEQYTSGTSLGRKVIATKIKYSLPCSLTVPAALNKEY